MGTMDRSFERERMVYEQLQQRGIRSERVLDAMRQVPRERFVPETAAHKAYADSALPIECEQTISQPYMVARMTELLALAPTDRVLEIGAGSGYQTAILARLAAAVYTVELHQRLLDAAGARLQTLGVRNVQYHCGDGSLGWPEEAPFDAILVTAGGPVVPEPLKQQLTIGGRLVVPIGPAGDQTLVLVTRREDGFQQQDILKCRFVKLVGQAGWDAPDVD